MRRGLAGSTGVLEARAAGSLPALAPLACALTMACGGGSLQPNVATPADPTPLEKCRVAASHESPLVTEWPASEKARLQTMLGSRAVAVSYSGCELRIVDECSLPGQYGWHRTTLSTDSVEIRNADELWAKLPLGAASLEGELDRSGRLSVRTTVSGQLQLEAAPVLPSDGACANVTHVVTAISIGAFQMTSGGAAGGEVGASSLIGGAGGKTRREESLVRSAGDAERCRDASDSAPNMDCGSPIQLFLMPVHATPEASTRSAELADQRARERGVLVSLPTNDPDERWALHDADGNRLCELPCERWIAPRSGYYLERDQTRGYARTRIDVPNELPHDPGTRVMANYAPERGSPMLSTVTFFGLGLPLGVAAVANLAVGLAVSDNRGFFLGASAFFAVGAAASTWWYYYSHPATFTTYVDPGQRAAGVRFGPGYVKGTF